MGIPRREPQEYSGNIVAMYLPGSLHSIIFLLYSWGSLSGVPIKVPLMGTLGDLVSRRLIMGIMGLLYGL